MCSDCKCLVLCPVRETCPLQRGSRALRSRAFFFISCFKYHFCSACPTKLTSLDLSCDMEQLLNRNIYLVKLYDLLAITLIVWFPCCLLFLQGLSACDLKRKQSLFFCCFIFRPNWWQSSSSGYGISLDSIHQEKGALELPFQFNNYNVISIFSSAM